MLASRVQSPAWVQAPQSCSARFPLTPVRAFVPRACKRSKATPRPRHPLTVSSFLELRLSTGPVALSPGPRPLPSLRPPAPGPRPPISGPVPGPDAAPAATVRPLRTRRAQSARPSWAPAATASSPPPTLRRATGGDQLGAGEAAPPGERPGRPQPARPTPPGPPPPPPHLARRHCRVSAARAGRRARCAAAPCAVPLPRGGELRAPRFCAPAPAQPPRRAPSEMGQ